MFRCSAAQIYGPLLSAAPSLAPYFFAALLLLPVGCMNLVTALMVERGMHLGKSDRDAQQAPPGGWISETPLPRRSPSLSYAHASPGSIATLSPREELRSSRGMDADEEREADAEDPGRPARDGHGRLEVPRASRRPRRIGERVVQRSESWHWCSEVLHASPPSHSADTSRYFIDTYSFWPR